MYAEQQFKFSNLVGRTIVSITGAEPKSEEVFIHLSDGTRLRMYHNQSCCESVQLSEVHGDIADLIASPILFAEESTNQDAPPNEYSDSWTWTFYRVGTIKGSVVLRWLGTSNGYYSESVTIEIQD